RWAARRRARRSGCGRRHRRSAARPAAPPAPAPASTAGTPRTRTTRTSTSKTARLPAPPRLGSVLPCVAEPPRHLPDLRCHQVRQLPAASLAQVQLVIEVADGKVAADVKRAEPRRLEHLRGLVQGPAVV